MIDNYYVIDTHCHIYPKKIAAKAIESVAEYYDLIPSYDGSGEFLVEEKNGYADKYIICSAATTVHQIYDIHNFLYRSVKASKGKFVALGTYCPLEDDIQNVINDVKSKGFHGFKIHPDMQKYKADDPNFMRLYEACGEAGLPVMIHTGDDRYDWSNPDRMLNIYKSFPKTTFIGAHFSGYLQWENSKRIIATVDLPNLYVDISSTFPHRDDACVMDLIHAFGVDRCMFGTDYPMWDKNEEIRRFMGLKLNGREKRKILSENAMKVYNISKPGEYNPDKKKHRGK